MADVNRIKLPDGNTYNLIDALGRKEAYLEWGGKNFAGSYGCIDAAMVSDLNANRFSFLKKTGITIEYTRDGGTTWTDYGASEQATVGLFNPGSGFAIGKADSTNKATAHGTNYQLRVTINAANASIYTEIKKVIIYCSTNGSADCKCQIFGTLKPSTDYTKITDPVAISGWSGYNVIQTGFTIGNSFNGQYNNLRFLFTANGGNTTYTGLTIIQILGFGGVGWSCPSTMAKTGHLYSYDSLQNATFPANITATKFIGPLQGNADTATNASKVNNHTVNADVPSGAVFTDTQANWTQTTSTALDYIKNKPTLGTASAKDVPASGNASTTQVVLGSDTRLSNARTPTSHTHGNIQNGGTLQTNDITIASGDKIVVTDSSDSAKVARTSISFDGSTATKALTQKGTWETFGTSNLALGTTSTTALKGDTKYAGSSSAGGSATSAVKLDTTTAGSATQPCYFTSGKPSACTYSLNKTVPSNAVFTDTNNAVTQTATTTENNSYCILFSASADSSTKTEGARKSGNLLYNPSTKALSNYKISLYGNTGEIIATKLNGATIGSDPKFTDTTYESKPAASGGTALSLVTTGDKYNWNNAENRCFPNYWSLFSDLNTSNTLKTINVVSGRKISDFSVLFAIVVRGGGERTSSLIPVGRFTNGTWVSLTEVDSANTQRWYEVKYVDDTHLTVQCSANAKGSEVHIYGLGNNATY